MREVTVAAIQMRCSRNVKENIEKESDLITKAAENGAQIILPSELFERQYFCQERRYEYYEYAKPLEENDAVQSMKKLAKKLGVVIPVSFYEAGDNRQLFNTVAVIDADGSVLGIYRKTHIPDDHYYQEKFYFTPGDTGFRAFKTRYGTIGVGICWDQWFPETARGMALAGAEILFYGLNENAIREIADNKHTLIITVDCGITGNKEIELAKSFGIDTVVTDHHEPTETLPDAVAVVDCKRKDNKYPLMG